MNTWPIICRLNPEGCENGQAWMGVWSFSAPKDKTVRIKYFLSRPGSEANLRAGPASWKELYSLCCLSILFFVVFFSVALIIKFWYPKALSITLWSREIPLQTQSPGSPVPPSAHVPSYCHFLISKGYRGQETAPCWVPGLQHELEFKATLTWLYLWQLSNAAGYILN